MGEVIASSLGRRLGLQRVSIHLLNAGRMFFVDMRRAYLLGAPNALQRARVERR